MQELNTSMSQQSIDLHGLSVEHALERLEWFLDFHREKLNNSPREKVSLSWPKLILGRNNF